MPCILEKGSILAGSSQPKRFQSLIFRILVDVCNLCYFETMKLDHHWIYLV